MKAKVLTVILTVAVAGSVFFNVKQYNEAKDIEVTIAETNEACAAQELQNSELESQIADAQAKLESLKNEVSSLSAHIETATAERDALQSEVVDLQAKVDQKHKEEEEAARRAAEEAEAAKKAASASRGSSNNTGFVPQTYVGPNGTFVANTEEEMWDAMAKAMGATVVHVDNSASAPSGGSLSDIRFQ